MSITPKLTSIMLNNHECNKNIAKKQVKARTTMIGVRAFNNYTNSD